MKKIYLAVSLSFLLLLGCSSPNEPSSDPEEFFPLKAGNKWYYNTSYTDTDSIDLISEVTGGEVIGSKLYFRIVEQNLQFGFIDTVFYRFGGDTLFGKTKNYSEQIIADFSLNLNDAAYWQSDMRVVQKTQDIMKFEVPFAADYGSSITFQRGLGIIETEQNGFVYYRRTLRKVEIK